MRHFERTTYCTHFFPEGQLIVHESILFCSTNATISGFQLLFVGIYV